MPQRFILTGLLILVCFAALSQGLTCAESDPFCTDTVYEFPAGTTGAAEPGPYYGCLATQPAPAWYHMRIANPGSITIYMYSDPLVDIDFICWGPFTDPFEPCPYGLTVDKEVDCSYSANPQEWCDIPNGQTGEYYILLITNYSQQPCNIIFSKTDGEGTTDCSILPPPIHSDSPLCVGETLHLYADTVPNATYSWTGPAGFSSTEQNPVIPNVTLAQAGDYSCVITVANQSSPPAIITVVINELPDAMLLETDTTVCPGSDVYIPVQLTGTSPFEITYYDGSTYYQYPGLTGPVDSMLVSPPGAVTYTLTDVSDSNCTESLTNQVYQIANFIVPDGIMSGSATICEGDTAQLIFTLTGNPPWTLTYLIDGANPQTVVADTSPFIIPVSPMTTTMYTFTEISDLNCVGTATGEALITVDNVTAFLSGDNTICSGDSATIYFDLTGEAPWSITYTANGSNEQTITATSSPFPLIVTPSESTLYECTGCSDQFCTGTGEGSAMITIYQPTGELSGMATICSGESAQITFDLTGNPPWLITYTENGGNPQTVTANSTPYIQTVSPAVTTTYNFTYFEDNTCPGLPSGEAVVTVSPQPSASAGNDQSISNGTTTTLDGSVSGGSGSYLYQWQPASQLVDAQVLQPLTVNLYASTLFTLTITDNDGGCSDEDDVLVTVTGGILSCSSSADPVTICRGETSQLMVIPSGGSGNYTFQWSSDPPGFSSTLQNPVVNPEQTTTYYVTVDDGYNITQSNTSVNVNQLPVPDAGQDQMIVYGTWTTLHGSATTGSGHYLFHWEPADKLNDPNIASPNTVNLFMTTLFTLTVTDSVTGCVSEQPDAMSVNISGSALTANPQVQPATICMGDTAQLFALAGGGTGDYTYTWTSDPPGFSSSLPDPLVSPEENITYYIVVDDGFNTVNGSVNLMVYQNPVVELGNDTMVCVFDTIILDAGNEGASYMWSNGSIARTISLGTTGIGFDTQHVSVVVTSPQGCQTTGEKTVMFDFSACSGIGDRPSITDIRLYPNPGNGFINIDNSGLQNVIYVSVVDALGQKIIRNKLIALHPANSPNTLDLHACPEGIYLIRIATSNGQYASFKYILNK